MEMYQQLTIFCIILCYSVQATASGHNVNLLSIKEEGDALNVSEATTPSFSADRRRLLGQQQQQQKPSKITVWRPNPKSTTKPTATTPEAKATPAKTTAQNPKAKATTPKPKVAAVVINPPPKPKLNEVRIIAKGIPGTGDYYCTGKYDDIVISEAMYNAVKPAKIILSQGTFNVERPVFLSSETQLVGQGIGRTILKLVEKAPLWPYAGFLRGEYVSNIAIRGMTLDGNREDQSKDHDDKKRYGKYGFYCEVCDNIALEYVEVKDFPGYGVDPHGEAKTDVYSNGFAVRHSIVHNNAWDGITIDKTRKVILENNTITNNGRHGINIVTGSQSVTITNNRIIDNGHFYFEGAHGCGINVQSQESHGRVFVSSGITMVGNQVSLSEEAPVCVSASKDLRIVRNNLQPVKTTCALIKSSSSVYIEKNDCYGKPINVKGTYVKASYNVVDQTNVVFS